MTLPASGEISFNMINVELGKAGNASLTINDSNARTLAGKPSGTISLDDFHGKSNSQLIVPANISYPFTHTASNENEHGFVFTPAGLIYAVSTSETNPVYIGRWWPDASPPPTHIRFTYGYIGSSSGGVGWRQMAAVDSGVNFWSPTFNYAKGLLTSEYSYDDTLSLGNYPHVAEFSLDAGASVAKTSQLIISVSY